jgi:hypothetical protein
MKLDTEKLYRFNSTMQLSIARAHDRFQAINAKPIKTAAELKELDNLRNQLAPFDLNRVPTSTPITAVRDRKDAAAAQRAVGIILNEQKVEAARLRGSDRLALHRDSTALAELMRKDPSYLSAGEQERMCKLKSRVMPFTGPTDREGRESDLALKVAA